MVCFSNAVNDISGLLAQPGGTALVFEYQNHTANSSSRAYATFDLYAQFENTIPGAHAIGALEIIRTFGIDT